MSYMPASISFKMRYGLVFHGNYEPFYSCFSAVSLKTLAKLIMKIVIPVETNRVTGSMKIKILLQKLIYKSGIDIG